MRCRGGLFGSIRGGLALLEGPKYDGKYLHKVVQERLGQTRLHQTLTRVVIPTFDIKNFQPLVFTNCEAEDSPQLDVKLSDICIGSSAAPTTVTQRMARKDNPDFAGTNPMDCQRFLVLSLGTGSSKYSQKYTAKMAANWGIIGWLTHGDGNPLIDVFSDASSDMVDYHISTIFHSLDAGDNYLRIQVDSLEGDVASVDVTTEENLKKLEEVGQNLLKKRVSKLDLLTGQYKPDDARGTNEEALKRFAKVLSENRKNRLKNEVKFSKM
nr:patatin-like protein 1 isoform X1 [Ipomoea trifida]